MTNDTDTSTFDPEAFMQQTIDAEMDTEPTLCPVGEYRAMIGDFDSKAVEKLDFTYQRGPNAGQPGSMTKFNLPWLIMDDKVKQLLGRDQVTVMQNLILDAANGILEWGVNKNIELGRIRKAVNQNAPGAWNLFMLRGAGPVVVKVDHITYERKDKSVGKRAEVTRVTKII